MYDLGRKEAGRISKNHSDEQPNKWVDGYVKKNSSQMDVLIWNLSYKIVKFFHSTCFTIIKQRLIKGRSPW